MAELVYTNFKGPMYPKLDVRGYYNYRLFQNVFVSEDFFANFATTSVHFRTLNHRLPIQRGRTQNILLMKESVLNATPKTLVMNSIIFFGVVSLPNLEKISSEVLL